MSLGKQIKRARNNKKYTQSELAEKFNQFSEIYSKNNNVPLKTIGTSAVSNWENEINDPDIDALPILCKVLNIDANELLELSNITLKSENTKEIYSDDNYKIKVVMEEGETPYEELPKEEKQKIIFETLSQLTKDDKK